MATPIGYHEKIWPEIPCTLDELARVVTDVDREDVYGGSRENSVLINTWHSSSEIDLEETKALRFRVMVNEVKRVACVTFRCTDLKNLSDLNLDASIVWRSLALEQIRNLSIEKCLGSDFIGLIQTLPSSVEKANTYVEEKVKPWAERKKYTLILGGFSLGGFMAQYVGIKQSLHNISFDGLWGASQLLSNQTPDILTKCATIVFKANTPINHSDKQIGRVYQTSPSSSVPGVRLGVREYLRFWDRSYWGFFLFHNMNFFYDYLNSLHYLPELSVQEVSWIYHTTDKVLIKDIQFLNKAFCLLKTANPRDTFPALVSFTKVSDHLRNQVYYETWAITGHQSIWEYGQTFFLRLSESPLIKAEAIENVLKRLRNEVRLIA